MARKRIVIHFSRIADRTAHLQCFQSLEFSIMRTCHIAHHMMRMQLRIKFTARIVHELRVNQFPGRFIIVCPDILTITHPDHRQLFQFRHCLTRRHLVCRCQTFIEQAHHGYRFRRRHLKVKEPRAFFHRLLRQSPESLRIDVLLKQTEHIPGNFLITQTEHIGKFSAPMPCDLLMLRIIIIRRQMIRIETFPRSIACTDLRHVEHQYLRIV